MMKAIEFAADEDNIEDIIKRIFAQTGSSESIPLLRRGSFKATLVNGGIEVDNLGNLPFLPWKVFRETISLLISKGGVAKRGDAMNSRLGDSGLPLDSIEGHIAYVVYGKKIKETVFRRITPIACILTWAGVCGHRRGYLVLSRNFKNGVNDLP